MADLGEKGQGPGKGPKCAREKTAGAGFGEPFGQSMATGGHLKRFTIRYQGNILATEERITR